MIAGALGEVPACPLEYLRGSRAGAVRTLHYITIWSALPAKDAMTDVTGIVSASANSRPIRGCVCGVAA
jgi:hypothetical protein